MSRGVVVDSKYCFSEETSLTVHKTCVFFPGDAFIFYEPHGQLIFRFDSYGERKDELVLMDASGKTLLTLLRKKPSLHRRWDGYLGERDQNEYVDPIFSVFNSGIINRSRLIVEVHREPSEEYNIKGSYSQRSCKICYSDLEESSEEEPVAEIKRKVEPTSHVVLGKDVFWLCVKPGFDAAFAMGIVLVLDQIFDDEDEEDLTVHDNCSQLVRK